MYFSDLLSIIQVFNNHLWLEATILDNVQLEHFHYHRKFYWSLICNQMIIADKSLNKSLLGNFM